MSRIQRRLVLLLGVAATSLALTAPAASATVDFPHEPLSSKWRGVAAYQYNGSIGKAVKCDNGAPEGGNCSFSAATSGQTMAFGFTVPCSGTWNGDIGWEGELSSTSHGCLLGNSQTGRICQHTATREYWLRLQSGFQVVFGYLKVDSSGLATATPTHHPRAIAFGVPSSGIFTKVDGADKFIQHAFPEVWGSKSLLIGAGPGEGAETAACSWAELS